jgi:hypothetical protein
MVVGLLLDVTLDLGYWVITRIGCGVVGVARYIAGLTEPDERLLAIDGPPQVAGALDAAALLRAEGLLDDMSYVRIVTAAVNLEAHEHRTDMDMDMDKDQTADLVAPALVGQPHEPHEPNVPSAPPPYEGRTLDSFGRKRATTGN